MILGREKKNTIKIVLVYIIGQISLVFTTGCWWDDWTIVGGTFEQLLNEFSALGCPYDAYIDFFLLNLPNGAYKVLVFILYLMDSVLLYASLEDMKMLDQYENLGISILFTTIPINSARVFMIDFTYTLCYFLFMLAFRLTVMRLKITRHGLKYVVRAIAAIFLIASFMTESFLVFEIILLFVCIWYDVNADWKVTKLKDNIRRILKSVLYNVEFIILPIAFFVLKRILFPTSELMKDYNSIRLNELPLSLLKSPLRVVKTLFLHVYYYCFHNKILAVGLIGIIVVCVIYTLIKEKGLSNGKKRSVYGIVSGLVLYYIGMFPYMVVRNSALTVEGVTGRDSLLLGIGAAVIIFYLICFFSKKEVIIYATLIMSLWGGAVISSSYMDYQKEWYYQCTIQTVFDDNDDIKNNPGIYMVVLSNIDEATTLRTYSLTGQSYLATAHQKNLVFPKINGLGVDGIMSYVEAGEKERVEHNALWHMADFEYKSNDIKGVFFINNDIMTFKNVIYYKLLELFDDIAFEEKIRDFAKIEYFQLSKEESDMIRAEHGMGKLTDARLHSLLVE